MSRLRLGDFRTLSRKRLGRDGTAPSRLPGCSGLATEHRSLGQLQESRPLLAEILASTPEDGSASLERGKVALDERQLAEAERWLRKAVEQAPDEPEANLALSQDLNQAGTAEEVKPFQERFDRLHAHVAGQTN